MEQGKVFRPSYVLKVNKIEGLNPFGTGQGLSTKVMQQFARANKVSIPLEQGKVFRRVVDVETTGLDVSIPLEQGKVFRLRGWFGALMDKA